MLGQRVWFDAGYKGMVHCSRSKNWLSCVLWGFKQVIGYQKIILRERKKTNLATKTYVLGKSTDSLFTNPRESPESAIKAQH